MAEHLTEQEIEIYRRRENDPDRPATAAHLAVCQSCLKRVLEPAHSALAVSALTEAFLPSEGEEPFHLSSAELKDYAGGSITEGDQIICESHLEICETCDAELRSLRQIQAPRELFRKRTTWGLTPARLAAAIALIGLLTLAVFVLWQRSTRSTRQEAAKNGTPGIPESALPPPAYVAPTPAVPSNPAAVASLKDNNREISLDQDGKITGLDAFDESTRRLVKSALAGEALAKPKVLDDLPSAPIKLLGDQPSEVAFQLIGPVGKVIIEQRPTLNWRALSGATNYVVGVFDANFNLVAHSPPLSKPNWTMDAPLPRGRVYSWEVTATKDGKEIKAPVAPTPSAHFKVVDADQMLALSKLKQQSPVSHLALGLTYARFGLVNEATAEFRKLLNDNPDSATAKRLLRTVQNWR